MPLLRTLAGMVCHRKHIILPNTYWFRINVTTKATLMVVTMQESFMIKMNSSRFFFKSDLLEIIILQTRVSVTRPCNVANPNRKMPTEISNVENFSRGMFPHWDWQEICDPALVIRCTDGLLPHEKKGSLSKGCLRTKSDAWHLRATVSTKEQLRWISWIGFNGLKGLYVYYRD